MIPYGRQVIDDDDIAAVVEVLRADYLTTGPAVEIFEKKIEQIVGNPVVSVTSGTAALHCAYAAIGIEPGDEVITPPITFIATQATAALLGAKIKFADIQEDTHNIDPDCVEALITPKTKAIVAVDYAGHPADMDSLKSLAIKHNLYLIEDAAHSIGSTYKNRPVGTLADLTTFSFFPTKNFTTGEGGAVASGNPYLLDRARKFARQGLVREEEKFKLIPDGPWHQEVHSFGLNYRLPDILCALGSSQIEKIWKYKTRRREIFQYYVNKLSNIKELQLPIEKKDVNSNWHLFPIQVPSELRKPLVEELRDKKVGAQVNYIPAYRHPVFSKEDSSLSNLPVTEKFYNSEISIPIHFALTDDEIEYICEVINAFLK